jgi:hypothetical protein
LKCKKSQNQIRTHSWNFNKTQTKQKHSQSTSVNCNNTLRNSSATRGHKSRSPSINQKKEAKKTRRKKTIWQTPGQVQKSRPVKIHPDRTSWNINRTNEATDCTILTASSK